MPQRQRSAIAAATETEKALLWSQQDDTMANAERAVHAVLSCITICTDFNRLLHIDPIEAKAVSLE